MADGSLLKYETKQMYRKQRELVQKEFCKLASVATREHNTEDDHQSALEGEMQNSIPVHPVIEKKGQLFDGIDSNVNPVPPLNTDARRDYDNEMNLQHQLRMANMPSFNPKPQGPY